MVSFVLCEVESDNKRVRPWVGVKILNSHCGSGRRSRQKRK